MRAYLRGGDRDQPAFSYAFEKSVMAPCRARVEANARKGINGTSCGLSCGEGFVNLLGHHKSADCFDNRPRRPDWSTKPPKWVCESHL